MMSQLLVDCEGIDAFDQTADYSTQIFSLGVLLSSLLVFNQVREGGSTLPFDHAAVTLKQQHISVNLYPSMSYTLRVCHQGVLDITDSCCNSC